MDQPVIRLEGTLAEGEVFTDLPARLRAHAAERPNDLALVDGATRLTFCELVDRMDRIAAALGDLGVTPGDVVATLGGITADHITLMLGIVARGAAIALLPTSSKADALERMVRNSRAKLIIADELAPDISGTKAMSDVQAKAAATSPAPPRPVPPDALFAIIYSSGTTGHPKGIEHDALFRDRQIRRLAPFGFGPGQVSLVSTPLYSNTTLSGLLPAIGNGSQIVVLRKFDELAFLELAEEHRVTHAMIVPAQAKRLLAHPKFEQFDLSAFTCKLSTSAPYTEATLQELIDRWPGRMINIYGMTEGGVTAMLDAGAYPDKLHTVGRVSPGADIKIIDPTGAILPDGETGEIVGHALTIMRGYRDAPEATRDATWISPDGRAYIRSGDIGRLDEDGFLTLLDRKKDVIISGGFNIFARDIEEVLANHPDVSDCAVVGVPSDRWGETPVGFVTTRQAIDTEAVRNWTNDRLGKLQRLAGLRVVDSLPRSSIGKILKRELRDTWTNEATDV